MRFYNEYLPEVQAPVVPEITKQTAYTMPIMQERKVVRGRRGKYSQLYGLCDPRTGELRYIGVTSVGIEKRFAKHLIESKKLANYRCRWINKLLKEGLKPILIQLSPLMNSDDAYWIEHCAVTSCLHKGFRLVNGSDGGVGRFGPHIQSTKDKISKAHMGMKQSAEQIAKRVSKTKGKKRSPEQCAYLSKVAKTRKKRAPKSAETRAKLSVALKGKKKHAGFGEKVSKSSKGKPKTKEHISKSVETRKRNKELGLYKPIEPRLDLVSVIDSEGKGKQITSEEFYSNRHLYVGVNFGKRRYTDMIENKRVYINSDVYNLDPARYSVGWKSFIESAESEEIVESVV